MRKKFTAIVCSLALLLTASVSVNAASYLRVNRIEEVVEDNGGKMITAYPKFTGMDDANAQNRINVYFAERAHSAQNEAKLSSTGGGFKLGGGFDYDITHNNNGIVSVVLINKVNIQNVTYREERKGITFNATTGKAYRLRELFSDNMDFVGVISDQISAQMKEKGLDKEVLTPFHKIDKNQEYYLTSDSLVIIFPENGYFTKAEEPVEFSIPLKTLKPMFRSEFASIVS